MKSLTLYSLGSLNVFTVEGGESIENEESERMSK